MNETPYKLGFRRPAEWRPHELCYLAWPSDAELWGEELEPVREAFVKLCKAIVNPVSRADATGEKLAILVPDEKMQSMAEERIGLGGAVQFLKIPFGDIWLRDTAPIFVQSEKGEIAAVRFAFNGWGGKYILKNDDRVAERIIQQSSGLKTFTFNFVLEGGSIESDGESTFLTTRQCLLNTNRNPGMSESDWAANLREALGCEKLLWLDEGLKNDHTDGHIDNLARFIAPGRVVCMEARATDDPNREVLDKISRELSGFRDAFGRALEVVSIPSPGRVMSRTGELLSASYLNFYIGNRVVVVPTFGTPYDDEAVEKIGGFFPDRKTLGIRANEILTGGGTFHCISQEKPLASIPVAGST